MGPGAQGSPRSPLEPRAPPKAHGWQRPPRDPARMCEPASCPPLGLPRLSSRGPGLSCVGGDPATAARPSPSLADPTSRPWARSVPATPRPRAAFTLGHLLSGGGSLRHCRGFPCLITGVWPLTIQNGHSGWGGTSRSIHPPVPRTKHLLCAQCCPGSLWGGGRRKGPMPPALTFQGKRRAGKGPGGGVGAAGAPIELEGTLGAGRAMVAGG